MRNGQGMKEQDARELWGTGWEILHRHVSKFCSLYLFCHRMSSFYLYAFNYVPFYRYTSRYFIPIMTCSLSMVGKISSVYEVLLCLRGVARLLNDMYNL